ncbi:hypothetical protein HC956_05040 [Alcaligenes faecalis]|uniref:Uncharacterized protein n=1 Tax=Alcaligenes ammonioxydans TaxID=2582914 RepID=A0ABX8SU78_9BURK|nr:hypothetical protein [Alcaligenes ammonioxydans]QXX78443.1 hypothetical protein FE795_05040 [Alcaligenes ammonioxydans]
MRYVEFLDIAVPGAGALGTIKFDPFLAAAASLKTASGQPLISHWFDPSPALSTVIEGQFRLRDAAHDGVLIQSGNAGRPAHTNALNSQPTFTVADPASLQILSSPGINANAWSLISVQRMSLPAANTRQDIFGIGAGSLGENVVFAGMSAETTTSGTPRLISRQGGVTTPRISFDSTVPIFGATVITGVCFSVELGISAFVNNFASYARNESDKRQLTATTFALWGNRNAQSPALGNFGMSFILREDISKPEYKGAADILLGGLMAKYGIV